MANVFVEESSLINIANAIREKNGSTDTYKPNEMAQAITDIQSGGGNDEYKLMWESIKNFKCANNTDTDLTFYLTPNLVSLDTAFNSSSLQVKNVTLVDRGSMLNSMRRAFYDTNSVETITFTDVDTSMVTNWEYAFSASSYNKTLKSIFGKLDFTGATNATGIFSGRGALQDIALKENSLMISMSFASCPLNAVSVQSIFDGLAAVTSAKTLTLRSDVKILQSQVDNANAIGWDVAGGTVVSEEEYYG